MWSPEREHSIDHSLLHAQLLVALVLGKEGRALWLAEWKAGTRDLPFMAETVTLFPLFAFLFGFSKSFSWIKAYIFFPSLLYAKVCILFLLSGITWARMVQLLNCTLKRKGTYVPFSSFLLFIAECKNCRRSSLPLWTRTIHWGWQSKKWKEAVCSALPSCHSGPGHRLECCQNFCVIYVI